jgi:uncharacterized protein
MSDEAQQAPAPAGAPSEILMALYSGQREAARSLAIGMELTLAERAAFGDLAAVADHVARQPDDIHVFSADGWTPLHLAGYFGYAAVVTRLLRAGASHTIRSRNAQGNTALHATLAGRSEMPAVTALLAVGSDPNALDANGYTPLHLAASRGDRAAAELLIACGADHAVVTSDGKTAADLAADRGHPDLEVWLRHR